MCACVFFFFQAEDGIRDLTVTGVQTCALPIFELSPGGTPDACARCAPRWGKNATLRAGGESHHRENRSEEHTSELQSQSNLVCRLLLEKNKKLWNRITYTAYDAI